MLPHLNDSGAQRAPLALPLNPPLVRSHSECLSRPRHDPETPCALIRRVSAGHGACFGSSDRIFRQRPISKASFRENLKRCLKARTCAISLVPESSKTSNHAYNKHAYRFWAVVLYCAVLPGTMALRATTLPLWGRVT